MNCTFITFAENGLFPHTSSCSKFYECANKQIFIKNCPPGTMYNFLIQACDFPESSGCTVNKYGQVEFVWKEIVRVNENKDTLNNWDEQKLVNLENADKSNISNSLTSTKINNNTVYENAPNNSVNNNQKLSAFNNTLCLGKCKCFN